MERISRFQSILDAMATTTAYEGQAPHEQARPFITISRQAGAGGHTLLERLERRLRELDPADPPWTGFDKELVELAAGEDQVFKPLVETLGDETRSSIGQWFREAIASDPRASEYRAYRRTAQTIRALAQVGRVILMGRGGVFITEGMPGGVHIHLVAPTEDRIEHLAQVRGISRGDAEQEVERIDRNRQTFYQRYWPNSTFGPEAHTVTFNTAAVEDDAIVESILPLVPGVGKHRPQIASARVAIGQ